MKLFSVWSLALVLAGLSACATRRSTEIGAGPHADARAPANAASSAHHAEGVDPDKALGWLRNGNTRFLKRQLRKDGQGLNDIERLAKGQKPHTIVLSCSDSRVPPELVFDQKLGEIFTVRTAGEALSGNVVGSIEYAVEHLGSRLIVVMGHTSCGAVKAALATLGGESAGSPALDELVHDLHPHLSSFVGRTPASNVAPESWSNARGVAHDLEMRSAILRKGLAEGKIKIVPALYDLATGLVTFEASAGHTVANKH